LDLGEETALQRVIQVLTSQESRNLTDRNRQQVSKDVRESVFEGLSLSEYVLAKEEKCRRKHEQCSACDSMVKAGRLVLKNKVVPLPYLWNTSFEGTKYDCQKAQRRLLQMPLAAITVNNRVYIVEKDYLQGSQYESAKREITLSLSANEMSYTSRADFKSLLNYAAQSESEKEILTHTICSSYNLSKRKASKLYGISRFGKRLEKISAASKTAKEIRDRNAAKAKEEKKA